ncbi:hypothetical protein [Thiolapillus sp.]
MTPDQAKLRIRARFKRLAQFPQNTAGHAVGNAVEQSYKAVEEYSKSLSRDNTKTAAAKQLAKARYEAKAWQQALKTISRRVDHVTEALIALDGRVEKAMQPSGSQDAIILSMTASQLKGVERKAVFSMAKEDKDVCRSLLSSPIMRHEFNIQGKTLESLKDTLTGMVLNNDEQQRLSALRLEAQTLVDLDDALEVLNYNATAAVKRIEAGQAHEPALPEAV